MAPKEAPFWQVSETDADRYLITGIVNANQLEALYQLIEPVSRSWRGQYQAMAKGFVSAVDEIEV